MLYLVMQTSLILLVTATIFFLVGWLAHRWFGRRKQASLEEPSEAAVAVYVAPPPPKSKDDAEAKALREKVASLEKKLVEKDKELKQLFDQDESDVHIDKLTQLEASVQTQGAILEQKTIALEKMRGQWEAEREKSREQAEQVKLLQEQLEQMRAEWAQRPEEVVVEANSNVDTTAVQELEAEVERQKAMALTYYNQTEEARLEIERLTAEWQRLASTQAEQQASYDQERQALEARIDRLSDDLAKAREIRPMPQLPSKSVSDEELEEAQKREVVLKRRIAELESWWTQASEKAAEEVDTKARIASLESDLADAKSLADRALELESENERLRHRDEDQINEWKERIVTLETEIASERERSAELESRMAENEQLKTVKKEPHLTAVPSPDLWAVASSGKVARLEETQEAKNLVREGIEDLRAEIRELREMLREAESERGPAPADDVARDRTERLERRIEEQERTIERLREERLQEARRERSESSRENTETNLSDELSRHFARLGDELQRLRLEIPTPQSHQSSHLEEKIASLEHELVRQRFEKSMMPTQPSAPPAPVAVAPTFPPPPSPWEARALELERELRLAQVSRLDRVESELWRLNQTRTEDRSEQSAHRDWEAHWFDKMADRLTPNDAAPAPAPQVSIEPNLAPLRQRIDELEEKLRDGIEDRLRNESNHERERARLEADWERRLEDRVAAERTHIATLEAQLEEKERKLSEKEAQLERQLQDRLMTMQEELKRLAMAPAPVAQPIAERNDDEADERERRLLERERELEDSHRRRIEAIEVELSAWRERSEEPAKLETQAPWESEIRSLHAELAEKERWIAERELELENRLQEKLQAMEAELNDLRTPAIQPEVEAKIEEEETLRTQVLALQEELRLKESELRSREAEMNQSLQNKLSNLETEIQRMEAAVLTAAQAPQPPPEAFFSKLEEFLESREKALANLIPSRDEGEENRLKERVMLLEAELMDKQRRLDEISAQGNVSPEEERRLRHAMDDLQKLLIEKERTIDELSRQIHELSMKLDPNLVGADNLQQITGIGPFTRKVLREEFGVTTFRQVARLTAEEIAKISERLFFRDRIQRDDWIGQAILLHFKKYNEKIDLAEPPYAVKYASVG